jgi:hypothetical protein
MNLQFKNAVEKFNEIILNELTKESINVWVAGGSIRDYFMGIPVKTDFDLFFPNEDAHTKAFAYFLNNNATVKWESDNGIKLSYKNKTFDLIKKYFVTPEDTINAFDFTVSMFAIDNMKVYYGETSFIDLSKRQLMINKITFPISTLSRAFRYYKKGFVMCKGEMLKLAKSLQSIPKEENLETINLNDIVSFGKYFIGID